MSIHFTDGIPNYVLDALKKIKAGPDTLTDKGKIACLLLDLGYTDASAWVWEASGPEYKKALDILQEKNERGSN